MEDWLPKKAAEWGALDVKRAAHSKTRGRNEWFAVGGVSGLLLQVTPNDAKSWVLRTMIGGQRRAVGLGPYPEVGLATARDRARAAKEKITAGVDPIEERRAARAALIAAVARNLSFADAVEKWMTAKTAHRPEKSRRAIKSTITRYALPELKGLTVQEITTTDVVRALSEVWTQRPDTAQKLRSYIEGILAWAIVSGLRTGDNPARWGGNLKELLPSPSAVEKGRTGNFPAVPVSQLPQWWADLSERQGMGALALRFAVLCASRSGEVRGAVWSEIDLDAAMWIIPPSRMKMGREHRVPLSLEAVELLKSVPKMKGAALVFPSLTGKMLSDMSISAVMRRMQTDAEDAAREAGLDPAQTGYRDSRSGRPAVPHGLRSSFRDWAAERGYERDLCELALAHLVGGEVERSYRRTDMLDRRRALMTAWADYLAGRAQSGAVNLREARIEEKA
jgi:integrase